MPYSQHSRFAAWSSVTIDCAVAREIPLRRFLLRGVPISVDRRISERIDQESIRGIRPDTLSDQELELHRYPLTKTPTPEAVTAWVRYGQVALKVDAEVVAWTPRSIAIRWTLASGDTYQAWVWANAVERK